MQKWRDNSVCLGMDSAIFFPEPGQSSREAKELCYGCPVRERCLELAMTAEEGQYDESRFGIYGGLTGCERYKLANGVPFVPSYSQCRSGHDLTAPNSFYRKGNGTRECVQCKADRKRKPTLKATA